MPEPDDAPGPLAGEPPDTVVGRATSLRKLRGQYGTPLEMARAMLARVAWPRGGGVLLDPACGDGVFLEAAIRKTVEEVDDPGAVVAERMVGWDVDPAALAACRERLDGVLEELELDPDLPRLLERDAIEPREGEGFACVVGNPPYLEAKRMPDPLKEHVRAHCPRAGFGAFDLYGAFVERAEQLTREAGGELCLIIPNRFLCAAYASKLRDGLLASHDLRVVDLSTEEVFADADVYPIVLHAVPAEEPVYAVSTANRTGAGEPAVRVPAGTIREHLGGILPVAPAEPAGRRLLERVLRSPSIPPLEEVAEVRWTVSFHRAGLRDGFTFPERPDEAGGELRRFLGGGRYQGNREVEPFRIDPAGWWIDYDEERAREEGNPFPPLELFDRPKVVVCQNARRGRAAVDRDGLVLKDTFLAVLPRDGTPPATAEWIALVLNSDLFHYLYEPLFGGTRKGGGYLHFLGRYLEPFPLPPAPAADRVRPLHERLASGDRGARPAAEALVREAYGVTASEEEALAAHEFPSP